MQDSDVSRLIGHSLGEYTLRSVLGVGGMAAVYRALDRTLEREVAVKVLPASWVADADYVQRFREEAKRVAALHHSHIVPIYAFGEERGHLYHVMPVLLGSLRDRLQQEGRLPPGEAIRLVQQIASALGAAHALGLVHRDVKPENILLDAEGNALLTDFGIARPLSALRQVGVARTLARTGMPVGTPEYMAPEQLRDSPLDQRVDVYALGAVLYELLTGTPPHEAASPFEVAALALSASILPPAQRTPEVWPALEQVMLKALAREPANRYPDMQSFSAALELALRRRDARGTAAAAAMLPPSMRGPRLLAPLQGMRGTQGTRVRRLVAIALVVLMLVGAAGSTLAFVDRGAPTGAGAAVATKGSATATMGTTGATVTASATPQAQPSVTSDSAPASTASPVLSPSPSPSSTAPVPTTTPVPTATPLLTPTIVVSSSPLTFQPYPSPPTKPTNCVAVQTLTNTSAVDAQWSWHNSAGGWQYNTAGFNSTNWQGFPSVLTMTTPAHSSVYLYIRTGYDTNCTSHSTVATITVAGGNGTGFNVSY